MSTPLESYRSKNAQRRATAATNGVTRYGLDEDLARLHACALFPPIGEIPLAGMVLYGTGFKRYYKALKKEADSYARAAKRLRKSNASSAVWESLALVTMKRYVAIAHSHSDPVTALERWVDEEVQRYHFGS